MTLWDFAIVGSGFGGSVSALRLTEKGYRVLLLEQGRRFAADDFPKTNWDLRRWMWLPGLGCRGLFKMTFFRHLTVLSGVGVGGGSLVYANTLPMPKAEFFNAASWAGLCESWAAELAPHYSTARRMLGSTRNPQVTRADEILAQVAGEIGRSAHHEMTDVAVYFGTPEVTVPDPYFGGEGPTRTGCRFCGGCMLGCRHDAKNTLDKNYLYLAERRGLTIEPETEVTWVRPVGDGTYELTARQGLSVLRSRRRRQTYRARRVIFAGGVLGTVRLLLRLQASADGLPELSTRLGDFIRTNSESLIGVVSQGSEQDYSQGVAITSILHTDEHSHLEPVRYPSGSGFFRALTLPHVGGATGLGRLGKLLLKVARHPLRTLRALTVPDWARHTIILLYMRTLEGYIRLQRTTYSSLQSQLAEGPAPTASMPEATELAERVAHKTGGLPMSILTETLLGIPTTAHILGGCCMGRNADEGVIDAQHRVFGYPGLYVVDGSAVSANPGVNPSLTICALAERAMSLIDQPSQERP